MKDKDAREALAKLTDDVNKFSEDVRALTAAYNELFDLVAADLGFVAKVRRRFDPYMGTWTEVVSPRRLTLTEAPPHTPQPVRVKPKRHAR